MGQRVSLTVPAQSDYIAVVRLAISGVAARFEFTIDEIEDIKVAVSEACTNVVQHAYNGAEGEITIVSEVEGDELSVTVSDSGVGFDPQNALSTKQSEPDSGNFGLGLGLTFIKSLMDEMSVESAPGKGCQVTMRKTKTPVSV